MLLGACQSVNDTTKTEQSAVEETAEVLNNNGNERETVPVRSDIRREFETPEVIELRELSEDDLKLYDAMMEAVTLNAAFDRDAIYKLAEEKSENPDEFWEEWLEISNAVTYREMGQFAISDSAMNELLYEILDANLAIENFNFADVTMSKVDFEPENNYSMMTGQFKFNQSTYLYRIGIKYSKDYREATITQLRIDGEDFIF